MLLWLWNIQKVDLGSKSTRRNTYSIPILQQTKTKEEHRPVNSKGQTVPKRLFPILANKVSETLFEDESTSSTAVSADSSNSSVVAEEDIASLTSTSSKQDLHINLCTLTHNDTNNSLRKILTTNNLA